MAKKAIFDVFRRFWAFLPKLALFPGFRDPAQGWFYINPSRRGPVPGKMGFLGSGPGESRGGPFWAYFAENPQNGGFGAPEPRRG